MRISFLVAGAIILSTGVSALAHSPYTTGVGSGYDGALQGSGYDTASAGSYHRFVYDFAGNRHAWRGSHHRYAAASMGYGFGYHRHRRFGISAGYVGDQDAFDAGSGAGFGGGGWSAGEVDWHSRCGCNSGWNF